MSAEACADRPARGNMRLWIGATIFLAYMVAFFDRANVSVLIVNHDFTSTLGISTDKGAQGLLLTVFLVGYGISCFFAGPVVNRFGPRKALGFGLLSWALLMAIMGAASSLLVVLAIRAVLGITESILAPSVSKLVRTWFPVQERAKANGAWFLGLQLAQVLSMPLVMMWINAWGWRGSLFGLAVLGVIPILVGFFAAYDLPSQHPRISEGELAHISAGMEKEAAPAPTGSGGGFGFLRAKHFWFLLVVFSTANAAFWGLMGWIPTYLQKTLGFSFTQMGFLAAVPYLVGAVSVLLVPPLMDRFNRRGLFVLVSCLGVGVSLLAAMSVTGPAMAVVIFSLAQFFIAPIAPGLFAMVQNMTSPTEVANATGVFNGVSYLFSSAFPYAMGAIYTATGNLKNGFYLLAVVVLIGVLAAIPAVKARL